MAVNPDLIKAAPDMFAALEFAVASLKQAYTPDHPAILEGEKALAAARGKVAAVAQEVSA